VEYLSYLLGLSIGGVTARVALVLGEGNREHSEGVAIGGLDIGEGLDGRLLLLDHGPELVGGDVHAVEVGQAGLALDFFDDELELPEGLLVLVEVSERNFEDTSLKTVRGDL